MSTKRRDRYGNQIELTEERWRHIVTYHPELTDCRGEVLATIQKGSRQQDAIESEKCQYEENLLTCR